MKPHPGSIFAQALLDREPSEPTEAPVFKQFGDYRIYPYAQMTLPRSSLTRGRGSSTIPICMWATLPRVA